MNGWVECTVGDLGEVVGGATPSTKNDDNYTSGSISWITPKDLSNFNGRYIYCGERNITELGLRSCSTRLLPPNTILFSSRAPIGYVAIAGKELCTNQGFKNVIPGKNTDFMFLYYLLKFNRSNIENMGSGTTFKEVSGNTMRAVKVCVPTDIDNQRKIAAVLSAIDDKIELNIAINENLHLASKTQNLFFSAVRSAPFVHKRWQLPMRRNDPRQSRSRQDDFLQQAYVCRGCAKALRLLERPFAA